MISNCMVIHFSDYASIDDFDVGGDLISDYTAALMNPSTHPTHQQGTGHSHHEDPEEVSCECGASTTTKKKRLSLWTYTLQALVVTCLHQTSTAFHSLDA